MSETSKQRRSRIDLTYYRRPDAQLKRRRRLTLLALVIAGGWFAAAPLWGRGRDAGVRFFQHASLASKGPLARAHAIWDANCEACHVPFSPVNGSRWSPTLLVGSRVGDESCRTCHAGPAHHLNQVDKDVPSCAECHRDHRGKDASLIAMDDAACTTCHRALTAQRDLKTTATTVTRFSANTAEHPAFTPPAGFPGPDSGRIKFNHALHMAKGLTLQPKGVPFTFASLSMPDRARYGWIDGQDKAAIQLRCDTCHRLDKAESSRARRPSEAPAGPRSPGDAMLPITYENDCRACHSLSFEPKQPDRTIPHGIKASEVVDQLTQFYAAQAIKDDPALLRRFVPSRPIPGKASSAETTTIGKAASDRTLGALRRLFSAAIDEGVRSTQNLPLSRGGCVECHELKSAPPPLVDLKAASTLDIKPVVVRSLWFESAFFDHATHRGLDCASCHTGVAEARDQSRPRLPEAAQCVNCHAPSTTEGGQPQGGAGTSCVECHLYHNGDHPAQGKGATARRGSVEMSLEQFLNGGPRRQ